MRELKGRAGLSYGTLARRLHTSTSTLHRYCNGDAVPAEFAVVDRFARACGASPAEALDLHRAWLLADARRRAGVRENTARAEPAVPAQAPAGAPAGTVAGAVAEASAAAVTEAVTEAAAEELSGAAPAAAGGAEPAGRAEPADRVDPAGGQLPAVLVGPTPVPAAGTPWYRRRGRAVAVAGAAAGLIAVLALAAGLPGGDAERKDGLRPPAPLTGTRIPGGGAAPTTAGSATPSPSAAPSPSGTTATAQASVPPSGRPSARPSASRTGPAAVPARPLTLGVRSQVWQNGCDHAYLIGRRPQDVPAPPVEQDAAVWASAQRAVHAERQIVEVTVAGRTAHPVVLQALHVRVTGRGTPLPWNVYTMSQGCGGSLTPAVFTVNLDAPRPLARPVAGHDGEHEIPAPALPMRVSAREPVVLRVEASASGCDCGWYLELRWTAGGRSGTARIDDGGRPFRTSAAAGRPTYGYASESGRWTAG
ncbi:helix-turn-helix domain-containing protein [Streptomyces sp. NBC_00239]|uniref:helix-turn-helix domain-containing protein n=1 Tax=Streptomyces sp. NBC_00239 TaxID=2903640 RepID=UPI003FA7A0E1